MWVNNLLKVITRWKSVTAEIWTSDLHADPEADTLTAHAATATTQNSTVIANRLICQSCLNKLFTRYRIKQSNTYNL